MAVAEMPGDANETAGRRRADLRQRSPGAALMRTAPPVLEQQRIAVAQALRRAAGRAGSSSPPTPVMATRRRCR